MAFIKDNSPPATIILISGDRDFAYLLSTIRWRKYNVVLISNSFMTHESLTAQASASYDWQSDILKARPPPKPPSFRSRRDTTSSVPPLTTSQAQGADNSSESDIRAVHPSNKHITPVVHPTHATPPLDTPFVEPEATPTPSKVEIPPEPIPASTLMTPASNDWTVADLTTESTTVHLSILHTVAIDLGFNRISLLSRQ